MANRTFKKGQSTFKCRCCARTTRNTNGEGDIELCAECYELAGLENALSDGNMTEGEVANESRHYFAELIAKKVPEATVKKAFPDLFKLAFAVRPETVELVKSITRKDTTKYDYPTGLTNAQKKAFRAKARRAK